jgi:hypothetical protein
MRRRVRTLVGSVATLAFVIVYALGAMLLAQVGPFQGAPALVQGLFYVALGLGWIIPLMPLVGWMVAPDE